MSARLLEVVLGISVLTAGLLLPLAMTGASPPAVRPAFNLLEPEQDIEIGSVSSHLIEQRVPVVDDRVIADHVGRVGERLVPVIAGPEFPYRFEVLDVAEVDAVALPGGPVYITRGLMEGLRDETELAGILAHLVAHVALRHGTWQASAVHATEDVSGLFGEARPGDDAATFTEAIGGFGLNPVFVEFGLGAERQANALSVRLLAERGYRPLVAARALERLQRAPAGSSSGGLSRSHPSYPGRLAEIHEECLARAEETACGPARKNDERHLVGGFPEVRRRLRAMPPAAIAQLAAGTSAAVPAPRRAVPGHPADAEGSPAAGGDSRASGRTSPGDGPPSTAAPRRVASSSGPRIPSPSRDLAWFEQPSGYLRVSHPVNWKVQETADGIGLVIAPPGGTLRHGDGRSEMVQGMIVAHYTPLHGGRPPAASGAKAAEPRSPHDPLDAAIQELVALLEGTSPHLVARPGPPRSREIDGHRIVSRKLRGTSPITGELEEVAVFVRESEAGHPAYALTVTPLSRAAEMEETFLRMLTFLQVNDDALHRHTWH